MNPAFDDPPFVPHMDLLVSGSGDLIMKVDLSGIRSADVEITIEGNKVRIRGKRLDADAEHARKLLIKEIPVGAFEGILEIPSGFAMSAAISAYHNGVLRITVPPQQRPSGRAPAFNPN